MPEPGTLFSARRALLGAVASMVVGCGGAQSSPPHPGIVECEPSMTCLPDPDVGRAELSVHMREGWALAEESFLVPPPEPPGDRSALDIQTWSGEILARWLERKTHTVELARAQLEDAAEESHRQRIMGGAIVGLMYEDIAHALQCVPTPSELDDEPEINEIFQDILRGQARPYLQTARRAYSACAQNAIRPDTMRHWSRFCRGREDRLPPEAATPLRSGETQVEVLVD